MDETDKIQEILDTITAVVSKTPASYRVEYHLAPEGCYAVIMKAGVKPFIYIPTADEVD